MFACHGLVGATWSCVTIMMVWLITPRNKKVTPSPSFRCVAQAALDRATAHPGGVTPYVTTDTAAVQGVLRLLSDHRLLVEPACACALAAVYERAPCLQAPDPVSEGGEGGDEETMLPG